MEDLTNSIQTLSLENTSDKIMSECNDDEYSHIDALEVISYDLSYIAHCYVKHEELNLSSEPYIMMHDFSASDIKDMLIIINNYQLVYGMLLNFIQKQDSNVFIDKIMLDGYLDCYLDYMQKTLTAVSYS